MSTATVLRKFEIAAMAHNEGTHQGDYRIANRNYDIVRKAVSNLRIHNQLGALKPFLHHPNLGVRISAATYLLALEEKEAVTTLETIAGGHGIDAFNAQMVLSEWRKGNLVGLENET